jgi:hypothetical protein
MDITAMHGFTQTARGSRQVSEVKSACRIPRSCHCFTPDFLDTELSVFMQQLRAQGAAGAPGLA